MVANGGFPQHCQQCEVSHKIGVVEGRVAVAGGLYRCASDGAWLVLLALVWENLWWMGVTGAVPKHCQQCQIGHKLGMVEGYRWRSGRLFIWLRFRRWMTGAAGISWRDGLTNGHEYWWHSTALPVPTMRDWLQTLSGGGMNGSRWRRGWRFVGLRFRRWMTGGNGISWRPGTRGCDNLKPQHSYIERNKIKKRFKIKINLKQFSESLN